MKQMQPERRRFIKMHGLGNDFVIFDARHDPLTLSDDAVRHLSDRHAGIGCDQLIIIRQSDDADAFMEIRNADGGTVGACGNATRCIAKLLLGDGKEADSVSLETRAGILKAKSHAHGIEVDMGRPGLQWTDIPLAHAMDTLVLDIEDADLNRPTAVSMGNPHLIFFIDKGETFDPVEQGTQLEHHPWFPEAVNVSFVRILEGDHLSIQTFERGTGLTKACGTGACASLVGAHRRGLTGRSARVDMPGGRLWIDWRDDGHVYMAGSAQTAFEGIVSIPSAGQGEKP